MTYNEIFETIISETATLGPGDLNDSDEIDTIYVHGNILFSNIADSSQEMSDAPKGIMIYNTELMNQQIVYDNAKRIEFKNYNPVCNDRTKHYFNIKPKNIYEENSDEILFSNVTGFLQHKISFFLYRIIDITSTDNIVEYCYLNNTSLTYEPLRGTEVFLEVMCTQKGICLGYNIFVKNIMGPETEKVRENVLIISELMKSNKLVLDKYAKESLYGDNSFKIKLPEKITSSKTEYIERFQLDKLFDSEEELNEIVNKLSLIDIYNFLDKFFQIESEVLREMKKSELILIFSTIDAIFRSYAKDVKNKCDECRKSGVCKKDTCQYYFSNKVQSTSKKIIDILTEVLKFSSVDIDVINILNDVRNISIHADKRDKTDDSKTTDLCERINESLVKLNIKQHRIAETISRRHDINYLTYYVCLMASQRMGIWISTVVEAKTNIKGCILEKPVENHNEQHQIPDLNSIGLIDAIKLFKEFLNNPPEK